MKIHAILHAKFEPEGAIRTWANKNGHQVTTSRPFRGEAFPNLSGFDLLISLGGPQSALNLEKHPYLQAEVLFIQEVIKANKKILGSCLGAQLIGEALGAKTLRSPEPEIGLWPVEVLPAGLEDPVFSQFSNPFGAMHWHHDMPGIPESAVLLAKSPGCSCQAFRYGDRIYGLQFHLEFTTMLVKGLVDHCPGDLGAGKYVRSKEDLLNTDFSKTNEKLFLLLDYLASMK